MRVIQSENESLQRPHPARKAATKRQYPPSVVIYISSEAWNRGDLPELEVSSNELQLLDCDAVPGYIPLELRGLPEWEGSVSLIDGLIAHGLPGVRFADIRGLAKVCKAFNRDMEGEEVWRLSCAALATAQGLYAPSGSVNWKSLFFDTLWPARNKWRAVEASEAAGFRIRVCARFRPRTHASNTDGLVLPLHQRLRLIKKGQKLGSLEEEVKGSSQAQLREVLEQQDGLSPELLQALLEAQQLETVMGEAESQARGGPKVKSGVEIEEGSLAAHVAAAAAEAANDTTSVTREQMDALREAEKNGSAEKKGEGAEGKAQEAGEVGNKPPGSRLLLVQPTKVCVSCTQTMSVFCHQCVEE